MYICIYIYICIVYVYVNIFICVFINMYIYIYLYRHISANAWRVSPKRHKCHVSPVLDGSCLETNGFNKFIGFTFTGTAGYLHGLHPRKLTAGTPKWRFGSDDFPFQVCDFQVLC